MIEDVNEESQEKEDSESINWFLPLLVVGIILVFVGALVVFFAAATANNGSGSVGVVIFIGPIPIAFGAGPSTEWLLLVGAILAAALFVISRRQLRRQFA